MEMKQNSIKEDKAEDMTDIFVKEEHAEEMTHIFIKEEEAEGMTQNSIKEEETEEQKTIDNCDLQALSSNGGGPNSR